MQYVPIWKGGDLGSLKNGKEAIFVLVAAGTLSGPGTKQYLTFLAPFITFSIDSIGVDITEEKGVHLYITYVIHKNG
uniref:Uncharacterized protein n=1 Tax=Megaselia scalaris TaxID=36166 RepID=T1GMQ7_MEGSC